MFNVVLVEPEIPPNTGNVGRLCMATDSTLHLVKPLGFSLDDRHLKRAGLDYWNEVNVRLWNSFGDLQSTQSPNARYFFLTTKSKRAYYDVTFRPDDFFVFGRETKGLPESLLAAKVDNCITIPMCGTRSLNLATAVAIVAVRSSTATAFRGGSCTLTSTFLHGARHPKAIARTLNRWAHRRACHRPIQPGTINDVE